MMPRIDRKESEIQSAVLGALRAYGVLCWPQNREKGGGPRRASHVGFKGLPDIGGVLPGGRALFVEVKRPDAELSRFQFAAHRLLEQQGAYVFVARCVEDVVAGLQKANAVR